MCIHINIGIYIHICSERIYRYILLFLHMHDFSYLGSPKAEERWSFGMVDVVNHHLRGILCF